MIEIFLYVFSFLSFLYHNKYHKLYHMGPSIHSGIRKKGGGYKWV